MAGLLSRMSMRERWLVAGAAVFIGSVIMFTLVVSPLMEKRERYVRRARETRQDLALFTGFADEYRHLKAALSEMERNVALRSSDMSLLAAMEGTARKLGLADRIASMKPFTSDLESGMVQSSVEMRVEKIDLSGLVRFIEAVETGPHMAVTTRLRIKSRFDDPALLDTTLLVTALESR